MVVFWGLFLFYFILLFVLFCFYLIYGFVSSLVNWFATPALPCFVLSFDDFHPKNYFGFTSENNDRLLFTLGNRQIKIFQTSGIDYKM